MEEKKLLKTIAIIDHIYGETKFINQVKNHMDLSKEGYDLYFTTRAEAENQTCSLIARCTLQTGLYDLREENAEIIRKTGQKLVPAEYDIIDIKKIGDDTVDLALLQESHRQAGSDFGDVYVIIRGQEEKAYYVDDHRFYPVLGFVTKEVGNRIKTGMDALREAYTLLAIKDAIGLPALHEARLDYLKENYPICGLNKGKSKNQPLQTTQEETRSYKKYSDNDIEVMKNTDLVSLAEHLGYHVKKIGKVYTTTEHDSIRFFDRKTYCRFSDHTGGNAFAFLMSLEGMTFKEAADLLAEFNGIRPGMVRPIKLQAHAHAGATQMADGEEQREFILPKKNRSYKRACAYLSQARGFSEKTLRYLFNNDLVYEDEKYGNVIFCGKDKEGKIRQAFARGTYTYGERQYKSEVTGSDKRYGFCLFPGKEKLAVFEAAIDAISYAQLNNLFDGSDISILALSGTADKPLYQYISDYPQVKEIHLCLDNDSAGNAGTEKIMQKYKGKFLLSDDREILQKSGCKDFNELLVKQRRQTVRQKRM